MISTQRIRETRRNKREPLPELTVPTHFRCPISLDLMKDPVTLSTGITYDRQSIEKWLDAGCRTCPVTNQTLTSLEVIPNHTIRRAIQDWCVENRSFGMERIVTPKAPITSSEVSEILRDLADAAGRNYHSRCARLVKKVNSLCKESERNARQFAAGGAASVLALAFDALATSSSPIQSPSSENCVIELEEILEVLTRVVHPLSLEGAGYLGSPSSLRALLQLLKCGSLEGRKNAVTTMKELISVDRGHADTLSQAEGFAEALVEIIREPICSATTKSSLLIIFYLISNEKRASRFADAGLVSLLLEMLVDSEKSISEKGLAVLDKIFSCKAGMEKAYGNALTVPILVKKMFRVSELATEFAVSALWRLCKNEAGGGGGIFVEGLQVGAFQKVLLLLQVGCSEKTKEKATEILKMMNVYRGKGECIDSMDFKQLKRPF